VPETDRVWQKISGPKPAGSRRQGGCAESNSQTDEIPDSEQILAVWQTRVYDIRPKTNRASGRTAGDRQNRISNSDFAI
jgi:hypothetical protein